MGQQDFLVSLRLGVAREGQLATIGRGKLHVQHLDGGKLVEHSPRCQPASQWPQTGTQRDVQTVGDERDKDVRLDPMFQNPAGPPFEDPFVDHAAYLRALLDENVEEGVAHFRKKLAASVPGSAQVLVGLLARLGRHAEAIQISLDQLGGEAADDCPSAVQLCQMAGDYRQLRDVARKKGDFVGFAAGIIHGLPALMK